MNLVERAKNIILSPKTEWPAIEAEQTTVQEIYQQYLVILCAIPAIANFIGSSLLGYSMFGVTVRVPLVSGIVSALLGYVLSLVMVYVVALIADALAPTFQGQKNFLNALKLVAFSMTPSLLAGVLGVIPSLAIIGLLASLYGIYVLYLGVPALMKVPQEKAVPYTVVVILCAIVVGVVIGAITGAVTGAASYGRGMAVGSAEPVITAPAAVSINTPQGTVQIDTQKLEAMNQKLEEINKQAEAAAKSGDANASMQAAGQALGALAGAFGVQSGAAGK